MQQELSKIKASLPADHPERARFTAEMDGFYTLFSRFLLERSQRTAALDWAAVQSPSEEQIRPYRGLLPAEGAAVPTGALGKLAVLKLNGGLGTTMGCVGPKSAIEVRDGMTFLDLTVRQIEVPLSLYPFLCVEESRGMLTCPPTPTPICCSHAQQDTRNKRE
jgi:UTP--glucose-1-phosphate uridylyltransferase